MMAIGMRSPLMHHRLEATRIAVEKAVVSKGLSVGLESGQLWAGTNKDEPFWKLRRRLERSKEPDPKLGFSRVSGDILVSDVDSWKVRFDIRPFFPGKDGKPVVKFYGDNRKLAEEIASQLQRSGLYLKTPKVEKIR